MLRSGALRPIAWTLLVVMLAGALAGCAQGPGDAPGMASAPEDRKSIAPGTTAAFPVAVDDADGNTTIEIEVAEDGGLDVASGVTFQTGPNGSGGNFVNVSVPEGASEGTKTVTLHVGPEGSDEADVVELHVDVAAAEETVASGDTASVRYVARFPNGSVFGTNVESVANSSIPKAQLYRAPRQFQPLNVSTGPQARFISGFTDNVVGVGLDRSVTFWIPPSQAYGNETVQREVDRRESIERNHSLQRVFNASRQAFQSIINDTHEEGDIVTAPIGGDEFPFEITFLNETRAELTMNVTEGEHYTHEQAWPNSSEVVNVTNDTVYFYITPTVDENETFTFHDYWPNASRIVSMNETSIVVEHTPEEGLTYTEGQGRRAQQRTVVDVTEDAIVVEQENRNPLAGETIVFDVTVVGIASGSSGA